jgi:GntR family transcriptional regulator, rspAB operon transcriptional repressor
MPITKNDLTGVKTTAAPLSTDLFNRIKEDILSGKLKKDQKLVEQSICDEYKVSRTPVREALLQLEMEGLVQMIPNRGAFVLGLSARDMDDMFILRKIYEVQAVRWAIERITDEEMAQLEETFDFMEFYTMKNDVEKMLNINVNFHQTIYQASHNRMLQHLLSSYQAYIRHGRRNFDEKEEYLQTVLKEHRDIFQAFVDKDLEAGVRAMESHMDHSRARHRP